MLTFQTFVKKLMYKQGYMKRERGQVMAKLKPETPEPSLKGQVT